MPGDELSEKVSLMPFLLRVELPDVPGSLGRVATAIGEAGGDIAAIEVVEHRGEYVVDDVLLELTAGVMPDSVVSACGTLAGVSVLWISRYAAGGNLLLDLEAVEALAAAPAEAIEQLVPIMPETFRVDWAARIDADGTVLQGTGAQPETLPWVQLEKAARLPDVDDVTLCAGAPLPGPSGGQLLVLGRQGGPPFLDSEVARFGHLVALAATMAAG